MGVKLSQRVDDEDLPPAINELIPLPVDHKDLGA